MEAALEKDKGCLLRGELRSQQVLTDIQHPNRLHSHILENFGSDIHQQGGHREMQFIVACSLAAWHAPLGLLHAGADILRRLAALQCASTAARSPHRSVHLPPNTVEHAKDFCSSMPVLSCQSHGKEQCQCQ